MTPARVALIPGGAKGIGRDVARELARRGWDVALAFRTSAGDAAAARAEIEQAGRRALAIRCDVSDPENVTQLVRQVEGELGRIDALIHCAGPYHRIELMKETPEG